MINYHELMLNQPRGTADQWKQYLVICVIGLGVFLNAAINAGMFQPVGITNGTFVGGEYVYQMRTKDYASSMGLIRRVAEDLSLPEEEWDDLLYNLYLDEESMVPAGKTRYMGGALLNKKTNSRCKEMKNTLLACNKDSAHDDGDESKRSSKVGDGVDRDDVPYEVGRLPKVKAAILQFPFTNGFLSCLINQYKVTPALIKYAKKNGAEGNEPVVLSTCSIKQQMCTHVAPLTAGGKFMLGKPTTESYAAALKEKAQKEGTDTISAENVLKGLKKLSPL